MLIFLKKSLLKFPGFQPRRMNLPTSVTSPLIMSETFRGFQIAQPGGAANFLIILTSSYLA